MVVIGKGRTRGPAAAPSRACVTVQGQQDSAADDAAASERHRPAPCSCPRDQALMRRLPTFSSPGRLGGAGGPAELPASRAERQGCGV